MSHEEIRLPSAPGNDDGYTPVVGESTVGLGEHLLRTHFLKSIDGYEPIRRDAMTILRRCRPFSGEDGRKTGLVVGYVQSGKTASMTCVSALARDNGCRLVIVLAGVTTLLLEQNSERFDDSLRGASDGWRIFSTDTLTDHDTHHIRSTLNEWTHPMIAESDRQTVLIMALKNHTHLANLSRVLGNLDLRGVPALIIDDEADQASLNTQLKKEEGSTNYRRIEELRKQLPHHTYLQYTATPQAPLLVKLDDLLSPEFAEMVEPGVGYTGGRAFFGPGAPRLVRHIPEKDLFAPGSPPEGVPDSLMEAMRAFFLGTAVESTRDKQARRSMLVHPSARKNDHAVYTRWVTEIIKRWNTTLRGDDEDDKKDLLDEMRELYAADLAVTDPSVPSFDAIVPKLVLNIGRAIVKEVNSEDGSEVNWANSNVHILIGGEKLNRGFTVEGLMTTYMPRSAGGFNADTLQQRARFFGYKQKYLLLCRLYLEAEVAQAFRDYVEHEEDVRAQLAKHRGRPLREWRRAFLLAKDQKPTRSNVVANKHFRVDKDDPWFRQRYPHFSTENIKTNRLTLQSFVDAHTWEPFKTFGDHVATEVSLETFFQDVLASFKVTGLDDDRWYGELMILRRLLERDPDARVVVIQMSANPNGKKARRTRTPEGPDDAVALFQGRSSAGDKYPGDAEMHDPTAVTVQLHRVDLMRGKEVFENDVPALAIRIPENLGKDLYVQVSK